MDLTSIINSNLWTWVILPILIFVARIIDVSLGTIRVIFISKGIKSFASLIGFFEVLIWLLAIRQIFNNLSNPLTYLAYGGGFATGTFIGILIEEKISIGKSIIKIITHKGYSSLIKNLKKSGYGLTVLNGEGNRGKVKVIFIVLKRSQVEEILEMIKKYSPNAFYSIEDVRFSVDRKNLLNTKLKSRNIHHFGMYRKGK